MNSDERCLLEEKYKGVATRDFNVDRDRLRHGEPLAYIIGFQPFLGLKISLDSRPLIPRAETEWWTECLLKEAHQMSPPPIRLLDLCAGSGAIGCAALAHLTDISVFFGEIEPLHKTTILKNVEENNLEKSRMEIRIGDLFDPFKDMLFDIIAINPPYIPTGRTLPDSVFNYEPQIALFAGLDGLKLIRRIGSELRKYLSPTGIAWIECDSEHASEAKKIFEHEGMRTSIRSDQYSRPRVIVVSLT